MYEKVFPTIMVVLSLLSMSVYLYNGNIRMTIYWFAAALLTASITY
jgi:hypothetical protein